MRITCALNFFDLMGYTTEKTEDGLTVTTVYNLELMYDGDAAPDYAIERINKTLNRTPFALRGKIRMREPEPKSFKTGEKVRLKSGGPAMIISAMGDDYIDCIWYDFKARQYKEKSFSPDMLHHTSSPSQ